MVEDRFGSNGTPMEKWEMTYGELIGHVIDDIT